MIDRAKTTLDIAQFYVSDEKAHALEPVLAAVQSAAGRGVRVRLLVDSQFLTKYPESVRRLAATPNIEARAIDLARLTGGIHHAKYIIADRASLYIGSANFDWRALEHIHEIGAVVRSPELSASLEAVFAIDWARGTALRSTRDRLDAAAEVAPTSQAKQEAAPSCAPVPLSGGGTIALTASPPKLGQAGCAWDLDALVELIGSAKREILIQVLTYRATYRDKVRAFRRIDDALRKAAARGVDVEVGVSDWAMTDPSLESLDALENVHVHVLHVPEHSSGPIAYARVAHAKYLVVDRQDVWIGTSNFEGDYFDMARNVALVARGNPALGKSLADIFTDVRRAWGSPRSEPVARSSRALGLAFESASRAEPPARFIR